MEEIFYPETGETEAPLRPEDVRLLPGSAAAARKLATAGYALVLISNQAAFAKGKTNLRSLWLAHERFVALLAAEGVALDGVYYSYGHPAGVVPHFSGVTLDRKPSPYSLLVAAAQLDLDLKRSWMIGDRETDAECALRAGVQPIILTASTRPGRPDGVVQALNLQDAVDHILGLRGARDVAE